MATLGFQTIWPIKMGGGNTEFVSKIMKGLYINGLINNDFWFDIENKFYDRFGTCVVFDYTPETFDELREKIHTIRHDPHNLWVPGRKIHMVVFNRTINRFQFAPVLEVKSVQKIEITYRAQIRCAWIDNKLVRDELNLSLNDGFESVNQFYQWFNSEFTGKIIHWTNLIY